MRSFGGFTAQMEALFEYLRCLCTSQTFKTKCLHGRQFGYLQKQYLCRQPERFLLKLFACPLSWWPIFNEMTTYKTHNRRNIFQIIIFPECMSSFSRKTILSNIRKVQKVDVIIDAVLSLIDEFLSLYEWRE